jgi:biotin carboxylase
VFVDAFSTGSLLVREAAPDYRLVHVRSRLDLSPTFAASLPAQHFAEDLTFPGDVERVLARLALYRPVAVICGSEFGVEAADEIAGALGLRGNDPTRSAARRDKYRMMEAVAAAGMPTARQHRGCDASDLLRWRDAEGIGRAVVKPLDSAGSDDVYVCESDQDVTAAADRVLGTTNLMLRVNDAVLIQEYLDGDEYIINTVSRDGQHWYTDAWLSGKATLAAGRKIYDFEDLLGPCDESLAQILPYVADVLDALGIRDGPAHTELILTAAGPRLLETAARISGLANPAALDRCTGANQVSLTLDCYLHGGAGLADRPAVYQREAMARCVNLIAHREIPLPTRAILDALEPLPAFHDVRFRLADTAVTRRTVDLNSSPGVVFLIHKDPAEIEKAYDSLRSIERELL